MDMPIVNEPHWLAIARGELGTAEVPGPGSNPRISEYFKATSLGLEPDDVPWCSAFVSWCLEQAGIPSAKSAWARAYLNWGVKLDGPKLGCIVVLARGINSGHVGLCTGSGLLTVSLLGGNQGDRVCEENFFRARVLGYRWPATSAAVPTIA